jgi:hypothetical protein
MVVSPSPTLRNAYAPRLPARRAGPPVRLPRNLFPASPIAMHERLSLAFLICASSLAVAQAPVPTQSPLLPHTVAAPPAVLPPFQVAAGTLEDLAVPAFPTASLSIDVVLGGSTVTLALAPHDLRRAGYQLLVDNGTAITPLPPGPSLTWQGTVLGLPQSVVALVVQNRQICGIVHDGTRLWGIQPLRQSDPTAPVARHLVYRASDNWNLQYHCGVANVLTPPPGPPIGIDVFAQTDLSIEIDFPQFQHFGNATAAQNDALAVVNGMDAIYRRDVGITFLVGTVLVRTTTDPYSSTDPGTLLSQFQNWWNANQTGVLRDVAMLFTGRPINGAVIGIAYVGQICNIPGAYGLTETMYAGPSTNMTNRIGLCSHEMGHLWNAQHCDATPDCRIMCSGLGGCSGNVTSFSSGEIAQIVSFRNTCSCLTSIASTPSLTNVTPNTMSAFTPPQLTINGSGLTGVNSVTIGAQTFSTNIAVVNDNQMRVTPPDGQALGFNLLTVTNSAGTSNPMVIVYQETVPMEMSVPTAVIGGTTLQFRFGGRASHYWYLGVALTSATITIGGFPVISGFSGLQIGTLDAAGIGSFGILVPPGILNGLTFDSQVLEYDTTTLQITGSSNIIATRVFF